MTSKSIEKKNLILAKAKQVFICKGFNGVTMQDIIAECNISRGGIYLYFSSVDEIFMEVMKLHNQMKLEKIKLHITDKSNFISLIDEFFSIEKAHLLNIRNTLKLALYEFFLAHKHEYDKEFFLNSFYGLKCTIDEILHFGVKNGAIQCDNIEALADMIMLWLEGLESLSISTDITEAYLDGQMSFMKSLIIRPKER